MEVRERGFDFVYYVVLTAAIAMIAAGLPACGKTGGLTGPGAEKYDTISAGGDADLRNVKKYNAVDGRGGHVARWNVGSVAVHDAVGVPDLQGILNDWNGVLGGKLTLVVGDSGSPITISVDGGVNCGLAEVHHNKYETDIARVKLSGHCARNRDVVKHELGHAIGFISHATDGGVMEAVTRNGVITDLYIRTLRKLYDLKPGTIITD